MASHLQKPLSNSLRASRRVLPRAAATASSFPRSTIPRPQHHRELSSSTPRQHDPSSSSSSSSSVSETEVSHFNTLAADWWSPHGSSRLLHLMNPLRHDFIARCLATSSPPTASSDVASRKLRYLDVGCGGGIFAESAARLPNTESVLGIDPTPGVLAVARAHARRDPLLHGTGRLEYKQASIEDLTVAGRLPTSASNPPQPDSSSSSSSPSSSSSSQHPIQQVDILSMFEVIEHVQRPSEFLRRCLPLVKPGGWLVGSTIARTTVSWLTTIVAAEDVLRIVPRGTHDWTKYLNEYELRDWFAKQDGWEAFTSQGVAYLPLLGWTVVPGGERVGNYFFAVRKKESSA